MVKQQALTIAETYDVTTAPDTLVLFSTSFQNDETNRQKVLEYVKSHYPAVTIEDTPCGNALKELDLFAPNSGLTQEEAYQIWGIASTRAVLKAKGNITAFIKNAHPLSTFCQYELPTILLNNDIKTINGKDKFLLFAEPWFTLI